MRFRIVPSVETHQGKSYMVWSPLVHQDDVRRVPFLFELLTDYQSANLTYKMIPRNTASYLKAKDMGSNVNSKPIYTCFLNEHEARRACEDFANIANSYLEVARQLPETIDLNL